MKKILVYIFCCFGFYSLNAQSSVDEYLEKIRNNEALLTAFMNQMPKGGDLHHHFSGSVYTETYVDFVIDENYAIDVNKLIVAEKIPNKKEGWTTFSELKKERKLEKTRRLLLRKWSVMDHDHLHHNTPDEQFFSTFEEFRLPNLKTLEIGMQELKKRAIIENVQYLETQYELVVCDDNSDINKDVDLRTAIKANDSKSVDKLLEEIYQSFDLKQLTACAIEHNNKLIHEPHRKLKIDEEGKFIMRYQNYVLRFFEPTFFFKHLVLACISEQQSPLVVGVNIVAPEHESTSMQDYALHMRMFHFLKKKYPTIKYSMHAGELTLGQVEPEELTWHISDAVYTAKANRIGHGVDLAHEKKVYELLDFMKKNEIPVEINLSSNEFILGVKNDQHPIQLYHEYGVPIVISSDDAGVLRSSLSHQYVLLAKRYPFISYADIKKMVYNSIKYSFIEEDKIKQDLILKLDSEFERFEQIFEK